MSAYNGRVEHLNEMRRRTHGCERVEERLSPPRAVQALFEPLNQACALFTIEPKKSLENELDWVGMLLGHDNRVHNAELRTTELRFQLVHVFHLAYLGAGQCREKAPRE
jgi:hypothetical protein